MVYQYVPTVVLITELTCNLFRNAMITITHGYFQLLIENVMIYYKLFYVCDKSDDCIHEVPNPFLNWLYICY